MQTLTATELRFVGGDGQSALGTATEVATGAMIGALAIPGLDVVAAITLVSLAFWGGYASADGFSSW